MIIYDYICVIASLFLNLNHSDHSESIVRIGDPGETSPGGLHSAGEPWTNAEVCFAHAERDFQRRNGV
jgi:hypothetical protein